MYKKMIIVSSLLLIISGCSDKFTDRLTTAAVKGFKAGLKGDSKNSNAKTSSIKFTKDEPKEKAMIECINNVEKGGSMIMMSRRLAIETCDKKTAKFGWLHELNKPVKSKAEKEQEKKECLKKYPNGGAKAEELCTMLAGKTPYDKCFIENLGKADKCQHLRKNYTHKYDGE